MLIRKVTPYSIAAEDNTKAFQSVPPLTPKPTRPVLAKYIELISTEFSMNMLETSEKYILLIGFWGSSVFTAYQLWALYFILQDLWAPGPLAA